MLMNKYKIRKLNGFSSRSAREGLFLQLIRKKFGL